MTAFWSRFRKYKAHWWVPGILILGFLVWWLWPEPLDPYEETAIRFVETAYVQADTDAVKPYLDERLEPEHFEGLGQLVEPGDVKIGSKPMGFDSKQVVIYLSKPSDLGNTIIVSVRKEEDQYLVYSDEIRYFDASDFETFEEIQVQKGLNITEWKNSELD